MRKAYVAFWNELGFNLAFAGIDIDSIWWLRPAGWVARKLSPVSSAGSVETTIDAAEAMTSIATPTRSQNGVQPMQTAGE